MTRPAVETPAFVRFARRIIRAAGERAGREDEHELRMLIELRHDVEAAIDAAVEAQRERGASWSRIALATGTTRQGAQQRWGRKASA